MSNRYASFYTALRRHPQLSKEDAVRSFTQGRTGSLRELDHWELQEVAGCGHAGACHTTARRRKGQ